MCAGAGCQYFEHSSFLFKFLQYLLSTVGVFAPHCCYYSSWMNHSLMHALVACRESDTAKQLLRPGSTLNSIVCYNFRQYVSNVISHAGYAAGASFQRAAPLSHPHKIRSLPVVFNQHNQASLISDSVNFNSYSSQYNNQRKQHERCVSP